MTMWHTVYPVTQPLKAWQYIDEVSLSWPEWVRCCCIFINGELVHDRRSGRQVLNRGEWLVNDLDGDVTFYTDDEFRKAFLR